MTHSVFFLLLLTVLAHSLPPPPDLVLLDVFPSAQLSHYCHRKPAILLTSQGRTLLAFAERVSQQDDGECWQTSESEVSVVFKRSRDGGRTWSDSSVVITGTSDAIGNPSPIDDATGKQVLLLVSLGSDSVLLMQTSDEGFSWTAPRNITDMITSASWQGPVTPGYPGGIQLPSGRLIIGLHGQHSYSIYSDDSGKTWHRSSSSISDSVWSTDCQMATFYNHPDDLLMTAHGHSTQYLAYSNNSGSSWFNLTNPVSLSSQSDSGASILGIPYTGVYKDTHLYITMATSPGPRSLVLYHSIDGGQTWKGDYQLWDGPSARSSLSHGQYYTKIYCLFERGLHNATEKISLATFSALI